jgi:hypothetical protein
MPRKTSSIAKPPVKSAGNRPAARPAKERIVSTDVLANWVQNTLPQATVQRKMNGVSCMTGGKVFAFTRPEGLAIKLPEARVAALIESRDAAFLVMGKRAMREWVVLRYSTPAEFMQDRKLFEEAMKFVASLAQ